MEGRLIEVRLYENNDFRTVLGFKNTRPMKHLRLSGISSDFPG